MRIFTDDEKSLLIRIRDKKGLNLYSLIDPWIKEVSFEVNIELNKVTIFLQQSQELDFFKKLGEVQTIIIQSVNLIRLFEDKGYIFTFVNANQLPPNPFTFGQAPINVPAIAYQFPDPRISKMFTEYSTREIFVTPELNKFITDGFITREEVRANRQYNITKRALFVTSTALLISIAALLYNIFKPAKENYNEKRKSVSLVSPYCDIEVIYNYKCSCTKYCQEY